jgi:ACS family pantothenate transporter-like MFS transporter
MNGSSSVFFAFWGIVFYPATDAATVSVSQYSEGLNPLTFSQGFFKGTIAVICVSVFMAILFTIVYWQDKRSLKMYETDMKSIEGVEEVPSEKNATAVVNEKGTPTPSL